MSVTRGDGGGGHRGSFGVERHHDFGDDALTRFDSGIVRRLFGYVHPYRSTLIYALIAVALATAVQVSIPLTVRYAVDSAVGHSVLPLHVVLIGFGVLIVLNGVLGYLQESMSARLAQRVIFDLRRAMFAHLQDVSLSFLDQTQVGRLMARLQSDVNALQEFMENSVSAIGDFFLLLGIVGVLLWMDLSLGLLTLTVLPLLILIRAAWIPWARPRFRRAREASSSANAALAENINGIRTVQENRREAINFERYQVRAKENLDAQIGSSRASQIMVPAVDILTGIAMGIVVIVGGDKVLSGTLGVGVMVAYIFYVQRFFDPIRTLSMQYTTMQSAMAAGHRIFEVLDVPVAISDKPAAVTLKNQEPSIELRNVTFGYRPNQPVLHDVSLYTSRGAVFGF